MDDKADMISSDKFGWVFNEFSKKIWIDVQDSYVLELSRSPIEIQVFDDF